jgi:acetylglutamate kinase
VGCLALSEVGDTQRQHLFRQLAAALRAEKLILMTDVPGVMRDKDDISTKYTELDIRETRQACLSSESL